MYKVTFYNDTGMNGVDVFAPGVNLYFAGLSYFTVESLDIISDRGLSSITVAASMEQMAHADLCNVGDYWYIVTATEPVSPDTTRVHLAMDYWDTLIRSGGRIAGTQQDGTPVVKVTGGITTRYSYPPNADMWGAYGADDPLMMPQLPLKLVTINKMNLGGISGNTIVQSLIDLTDLGDKLETDINGIPGITIYSGEDKRVEPKTKPPANTTLYYEGAKGNNYGEGTVTDWPSIGPLSSPGTKCYDLTFSNVANGLGLAQAWNVKNALISSVRYPVDYVDIETNTDANSVHRGEITSISGVRREISIGFRKEYKTLTNPDAFHKCIFWGPYRRFGIITAKGDRAEFTPQDVQDPNEVTYVADPRPDGCPYFRFSDFHGDSSWANFFTGAVAGLSWEQAQLNFEGKAGSYMDTVNFKSSRAQVDSLYNYQQSSGAFNQAAGIFSGAGEVAGKVLEGKMSEAFSGAMSMATSTLSAEMAMEQTRQQYELVKANQLANFNFSQNVLVPEVMFPFSANIVRDFVGNGFIVYDYQYQDADLLRVNNLLTMFGIKCALPLTNDMLFKMDGHEMKYIQAGSISLSGRKLPRWFVQGLEMQIRNGIRMWNVAPKNPEEMTQPF